MERREEIGRWYDDFAAEQEKTSVNLRHYRIMGFLINAGLKPGTRILETGCGIGTLTGLLSRYNGKGEILAVDISQASVDIARKRLKSARNVSFMVSDMSDFSHPGTFDFIILPDVLEHIPADQHKSLFRTLANHMHDESRILIHIPHPRAIDFIRKNSPGQLQIIDQAVEADTVMVNAYASDLELVSYISYPLFDRENDYAVIILRKKTDVMFSPLPARTIIVRKLVARIKFILSAL